uniref:Uncharacterized protein n=1 Tax=viral metagenome TaxID=1070528 RepID=A0A6M3KI35_9ZZZZ
MKVKITELSSNKELSFDTSSGDCAIMIVLNKSERKQIEEMPKSYTKYCVYPDSWSKENARKWMGNIL